MLNNEIAAVIRTLRQMRALTYEELADVTVRRSISSIEQGHVNVTVNKLAAFAQALDFDLVAMMAICQALKEQRSPESVLDRAKEELVKFSDQGGLDHLQSHISKGKIALRRPGKPANVKNHMLVRNLKEEGLTQAEVARNLGLAKSTVSRYWKRETE